MLWDADSAQSKSSQQKKNICEYTADRPVLSQWPIPSHRQKCDSERRELAELGIDQEPHAHNASRNDGDGASLIVAYRAAGDN